MLQPEIDSARYNNHLPFRFINSYFFGLFCFFTLLLCFSFTSTASAKVYLPEDLRPWAQWVNHDKQFLNCYVKHTEKGINEKERQCWWPSTISIELGNLESTFFATWVLDKEGFVPLVGNEEYWPSQVLVNGEPAAVIGSRVNRHEVPGVWLSKGRYDISGVIPHEQVLSKLPLNTGFAQINIFQNGKSVPFNVDSKNVIELRSSAQTEGKVRVATLVERELSQDIHWSLNTVIEVIVADSTGEVVIGPVIPLGFSVVELSFTDKETESEQRFVLDKDLMVRATLVPGSYWMEIKAVANRKLMKFERANLRSSEMPQTELWAVKRNDLFGEIKFRSGERVDKDVSELLENTDNHTFFRVDVNNPVSIQSVESKHIKTSPHVSLDRKMWFGFDGKNITFEDRLIGSRFADYRLETSPTVDLLSAKSGITDIYVNQLPNGHSGVEWRTESIDLQGLGTITPQDGAFLVSGWNVVLSQADLSLYLPPATKLIAVLGADSSTGDWVSQWSLFSIFISLFLTVLFFRVFDWKTGALLGLFLLICLHEIPYPFFFINGLLAVALQKQFSLINQHMALKVYSLTSLAGLLVCSVLFLKQQVLFTLYPQLENTSIERLSDQDKGYSAYLNHAKVSSGEVTADIQRRTRMSSIALEQEGDEQVERITVTGSRINREDLLFDEGIVQAGVSRPDWSWTSHHIAWNSPVSTQQSYQLIILNATELAIVRAIGFACLILLLWSIFSVNRSDYSKVISLLSPKKLSTNLTIFIALLGLTGLSDDAYAEVPPQSMLSELEQRLLQPDLCRPTCVLADNVDISVQDKHLSMRFSINVAAASALPLFKVEDLDINAIELNGQAVNRAFKDSNGYLVVALPPGIHQLTVNGFISSNAVFSLEFATKPKRVLVNANLWEVYGLDPIGRIKSKALQFEARKSLKEGEINSDETVIDIQPLPATPLVLVYRHVFIDSSVRVDNQVLRVAPKAGVLNTQVPLLPQEIATSEISVVDGRVNIFMERDSNVVGWLGRLQHTDNTLTFTAANDPNIIEIWTFQVSDRWHLNESHLLSRWKNQSSLEIEAEESFYLPQVGESMTLSLERLQSFDNTLAVVDDALVSLFPGLKTSKGELFYSVRSPSGIEQMVSLPKEVKVLSVRFDGKQQNIRLENTLLTLEIPAGETEIVIEFEAQAIGLLSYQAPRFDLNLPVSNLSVHINNYPAWLMYSQGPLIGIAVLYWGQLLLFLVLAYVFGRVKGLPISRWQWVVFGLGVSVSSWLPLWMLIAFCIAIWIYQHRLLTNSHFPYLKETRIALVIFGCLILLGLLVFIPSSLFSRPDMGIIGNESTLTQWRWFLDRSTGMTPEVTLFSAPFYVYKAFLVIWSLWLSFAVLNWSMSSWKIIFQKLPNSDKTKEDDSNAVSDESNA